MMNYLRVLAKVKGSPTFALQEFWVPDDPVSLAAFTSVHVILMTITTVPVISAPAEVQTLKQNGTVESGLAGDYLIEDPMGRRRIIAKMAFDAHFKP